MLKLEKRQGSPHWQIAGTVAGTRVRESARTASRQVAESLRIRREAELEARRVHGPGAVATFAQALNLHLDATGNAYGNAEASAGENAPSRKSTARYLARLLERFGAMRLSDLNQGSIDAAARALYPRAKASTANRCLYTPFIAVMNAAARADLTTPRAWRRPKGHNKRTRLRWLWPDEFEAVWQAAPPHGRLILDAFAGTGMREGEGLGLDWEDVRLDLGQAWIWAAKNDEARRIELPGRAATSIATALHREGPVLLNGGGAPYALSNDGGGALAKGLKAWAEDAGVAPFAAHVLRHTWATWFYSASLDPVRLKVNGGWLSGEWQRYTHLAPRGLKGELARYGWEFGGEISGGVDGRENTTRTACVNFVPTLDDIPHPFTTLDDTARQLPDPEKKARRQ